MVVAECQNPFAQAKDEDFIRYLQTLPAARQRNIQEKVRGCFGKGGGYVFIFRKHILGCISANLASNDSF